VFLNEYAGVEMTSEDIADTAGMSISDLKEIVLSAKRRGQTFSEAIAFLNERKRLVRTLLKQVE
jgi:hypothetical protein